MRLQEGGDEAAAEASDTPRTAAAAATSSSGSSSWSSWWYGTSKDSSSATAASSGAGPSSDDLTPAQFTRYMVYVTQWRWLQCEEYIRRHGELGFWSMIHDCSCPQGYVSLWTRMRSLLGQYMPPVEEAWCMALDRQKTRHPAPSPAHPCAPVHTKASACIS